MTGNDVGAQLLIELSAVAHDRWADIRRAVAAQIAADLLAELDRPPSPAIRLYLERQLRVDQRARREVA